MGIQQSCKPREDILTGAFNPEIFTAALSEVLRFYRGESTGVHEMYTNADVFFKEATYPTDGLKMVLSEVFGRISGDNSYPAIHRLETAFGGGKTHSLIACTHLAYKGKDLAKVVSDILDVSLLPAAGEVAVVGIAGDEVPVHQQKGTALVPHTLWGEIAFQVGGESLYRSIQSEVESAASPGKNYFDAVFKQRKVLIMLDELAQYAARLTAANPDGGEQLAAFLMSLHGYARNNPGISIIVTLASAKDAFANQTERLAELLSKVVGKDIEKDAALGIGQEAVKGVSSVVARDATAVVPVQAAEISRVLGKRLFQSIDQDAAGKTAASYAELYQKSMSMLPQEASQNDYKDRMVSHYPFHPTLIDFLNKKLATSEDFQGTRGVLRVLALAVRSLWKKNVDVPMIHACHIDMRDARTVNEIIGRTGAGDLLPVLNADVGGVDTDGIEGGKSNAELADNRNPHPEKWPMYEYTWKTVFLHSLVGREQGLGSNIFGLTEQDALFNVSFPGLTPPQVAEALKEVQNSAFYLRYNDGRFYASLDPSVNIALSKLRRSLAIDDVDQVLDDAARKVVTQDVRTFKVVHDVCAPEHIPDGTGKPVLAVVSLHAEDLSPRECITTVGPNAPRTDQNHVFLVVPDTVSIKGKGDGGLFGKEASEAEKARNSLREVARTVLAMRKLQKNPQSHGIKPGKLDEDAFRQRYAEREKALETEVTQSYKSLWFPSASGDVVRKEIKTAGGEGGASVLEKIREVLLKDGELVTADHDKQGDLAGLSKLFFAKGEIIEVQKIREQFARIRSWPILDNAGVLDQIVRSGVTKGVWCIFRMGNPENTKPDEIYGSDQKDLPYDLDLSGGFSLITPEGANKRGWTEGGGVDLTRVNDMVRDVINVGGAMTVSDIHNGVSEKYGNVSEPVVKEAIAKHIQAGKAYTYKGKVDQNDKPGQLTGGSSAIFYKPESDDVIIVPSQAAEKGWISAEKRSFNLSGKPGAGVVLKLLRQIGSFYNKGATSTIDSMDLVDLALPQGGTLRVLLSDVPPESMKDLGEFFEVIDNLVQQGETTEGFLDINEPSEECSFLKRLRELSEGK